MKQQLLQDWVQELSLMKQTVLICALRGPDGMPKDNPAKNLLRWYRRCVLITAFEKKVLATPYEPGGGSFTGPVTLRPYSDVIKEFFKNIDSMPVHFIHHFVEGAKIIAFYNPNQAVKIQWRLFLNAYCRTFHVILEDELSHAERLSDDEDAWRNRSNS